MSPLLVFRVVAVTEALSWVGLLTGMFFKYVVDAGEVGVHVFGPIHGAAFVAYVAVTIAVAVSARWSLGRLVLGLVSSVPPLMTLWFDRYAERRDLLPDTWSVAHRRAASSVE